MKKMLCLSLVFSLFLGLLGCSGNPSGKVVLLDGQGNSLATVTSFEFDQQELVTPHYAPYVRLALQDAVAALMTAKTLTQQQAKEELMTGGYTLHTAFSGAIFTSLSQTAAANADLGLGIAVTDLQGRLLAVYGEYATYQTAPHSSLKPLSVYAPYMEQAGGGWSDVFEDSPYSQVDGEDWPRNSNGKYTYKNTMLYEGVAHSVNTLAVKTLKQLGVGKSIAFLQSSFDMSLEQEKGLLGKEADGGLANLALGSLHQGVTPVDMAGYYQIFGNEGKYQKPTAMVKLENAQGVVWEYAWQPRQVISYETAFIMNKLLAGVVNFGTGKDAKLPGIPVVGKTGTGRYESTYDNWFVGVTPAYCVAVYHGQHNKGNIAPGLFASAVMGFPQGEKTAFPTCSTVKTQVYCTATGKAWTPSCAGMTKGYGVSAVENCTGCSAR